MTAQTAMASQPAISIIPPLGAALAKRRPPVAMRVARSPENNSTPAISMAPGMTRAAIMDGGANAIASKAGA